MPTGGMARLRSFTITFSQVSAELAGCSPSMRSSIRPPVFSFSLWQETQYCAVRSVAGEAEAAEAAIENAPMMRRGRIFARSLRTALVLGFARMAQSRIRAVLAQQLRAFLVIKDAAEAVARTVRRQIRSHAGFAHRVD